MSNNITITFPDGNTKLVEKGISGFELANQISKSLAKESVAIKIDGQVCDLSLPLNQDCKVIIIKKDNLSNVKKVFEALEGNVIVSKVNNKKAEVNEL